AVPEEAHRGEGRRQDEEERLKKVHQDIQDLKQRLEQNESAAGSVLDAIEELDLRMALLRRESESLREEVRGTAEREWAARLEAETDAERLRETETALRSYLRETYKIGPARYLRVVSAASSPAQMAAGYRARAMCAPSSTAWSARVPPTRCRPWVSRASAVSCSGPPGVGSRSRSATCVTRVSAPRCRIPASISPHPRARPCAPSSKGASSSATGSRGTVRWS